MVHKPRAILTKYKQDKAKHHPSRQHVILWYHVLQVLQGRDAPHKGVAPEAAEHQAAGKDGHSTEAVDQVKLQVVDADGLDVEVRHLDDDHQGQGYHSVQPRVHLALQHMEHMQYSGVNGSC